VYRPIHDPSDQQIFQQDIDTLLHWSHNWQMNLNAKKCCMLAVSSKRQKHVRSYTLGNVTLLSVESFTYLSHSIFGHEHITAVSAKATHVLNLLLEISTFALPIFYICINELVEVSLSTFLLKFWWCSWYATDFKTCC